MTTVDQAELLRRWIAGELDEASTGRLAEGLADSTNRQQVCDDLRFDYALYEALTVERAQRRFAQRRTIMSWLPRTAAAAAVLLLGLYLGRSWRQSSPVGTVTAGTGTASLIHHGQSRPLSVGVQLQGALHRTHQVLSFKWL